MTDYGFKVSQPGYDVKTCTDKECIFTSKYDLMKVKISGSYACTGGVWNDITHDLGYYPNYFCFYYDTDAEGNVGVFPMGLPDFGAGGINLNTYTTTTKLYMKPKNNCTVYFYIFVEKGAS